MRLDFAGLEWTPGRLIAAALVIPLVLWIAWGLCGVWLISRYWGGTGELKDLGPTGDIFGGINALFAAYAFIGVAAAAIFQYQTFLVVEKQQRQQAFEPLFFQLLQFSRKAFPESLIRPDNGALVPTREVIEFVAHDLSTAAWFPQRDNMSSAAVAKQVSNVYDLYYLRNESALGPYFRLLYQTFKLIDASGLSKGERIGYANIARAALNDEELFLLTINCITPRGAMFAPLIERYGLLKHQPARAHYTPDIVAESLREKVYASTAWKSSEEREAQWAQNENARPANMH